MVLEAIRLLRRELDGRVPLIGFAGAPFTLASYAIEGGHSRALRDDEGAHVRRARRPGTGWPRCWPTSCADYLRAQVEAGAQALQLFDSWVGALDEADYREFVLPHVRRIFDGSRDIGVPRHPLRHRHRPPAGRCSARRAAT